MKRKFRRPMWIAAGAVVSLFVAIGALAEEEPSTTDSAVTLSTTTTTTTSPAEPVPQPQPNPEPQAPPAPNRGCHPGYTPCVPIASDVDCEGGSGDGPEYVRGPVTVVGPDVYRLDGEDNDGIGCE